MLMPWTPEREAELARLWMEGFSASQIATQLGDTTRNAVIGKVDRMKLSSRDRAWRPVERPAPTPRERRQGRKHRTHAEILVEAQSGTLLRDERAERPHGNAGHPNVLGILKRSEQRRLEAEVSEDKEVVRLLKSDVWLPLPGRNPVPLEALDKHDCRWPLGDPLLPGFGYCGLPQDGEHSRYCTAHRRVSVEGAA